MIQSISAMRAAAASAESTQPAPIRTAAVAISGQFADAEQLAGDVAAGFGARMRNAVGETELPPSGFPVVAPQAEMPAALSEQGEPMLGDGTAVQGADAQQELTPEQWLLGMIDQQLADIQARDAAQLSGSPEPLPQTLPSAVAERVEELLAWSAMQAAPPGQQAVIAQVDPYVAMAADGWQAKSAAASLAADANQRATLASRMGMTQAQPMAAQAQAHVEPLAAPPVEQLLATLEPLEAGDPLTTAPERGQTTPHTIDRTLKLLAPEAKWGEQMLHALRENVELQIQQKIQSATIRLDPPELGSLEILLSHDSGRLSVQVSAAHADVARLLQQTSDRLRQELVSQHFVQVNVQVSADSQQGQGQQRQRAALADDEIPQAARQFEQEQGRTGGPASDVLVTV